MKHQCSCGKQHQSVFKCKKCWKYICKNCEIQGLCLDCFLEVNPDLLSYTKYGEEKNVIMA